MTSDERESVLRNKEEQFEQQLRQRLTEREDFIQMKVPMHHKEPKPAPPKNNVHWLQNLARIAVIGTFLYNMLKGNI